MASSLSPHQFVELRALARGTLVLDLCPACRRHRRGEAFSFKLHAPEVAPVGSGLELHLENDLHAAQSIDQLNPSNAITVQVTVYGQEGWDLSGA